MIFVGCAISAVVKPENYIRAVLPEFSNKVCRECALWGNPNSPCRDRLIVTKENGSYSNVKVTCQDYTKDLGLTIADKLKELELAKAQYATSVANIDSFIKDMADKKDTQKMDTKSKMKALMRTLDGNDDARESAQDRRLAELNDKRDKLRAQVFVLENQLEDLKQKRALPPQDKNGRPI